MDSCNVRVGSVVRAMENNDLKFVVCKVKDEVILVKSFTGNEYILRCNEFHYFEVLEY